jgi:integrase
MRKVKIPKATDKVSKLIDYYLHSPAFAKLSPRSQKDYEYHLARVNKSIGSKVIEDVTAGMLNKAYEKWEQDHGIRTANYTKSVLSRAWKYSMSKDVMRHNPVSLIETSTERRTKTKWDRASVKTFLTTAYSQWRWRSIGLIVHMAYDWGQRTGDMRTLTWGALDLDQCRMDLTQSKRGADVHLPISQNLCKMLREQHKDFGFQDYVAPKVSLDRGQVRRYGLNEIAPLINEVLDEANLPRELTAMSLRRTAVTEMMEAGVDLVGIMQVTGHVNPASLKPYMVNTFSGASRALAARGNDDEDS